MFKEATPLVVDDDHQGAVPVRATRKRVVDLSKQRLTIANIRMRMVVARNACRLAGKTRVDHAERWQRTRRRVREKILEQMRDAEILRAIERGEWHVVIVVIAADIGRIQPVPDGRQLRRFETVVEPVRCAAVQIDPVRIGAGEDAAEIEIADRIAACHRTKKLEVALCVVTDWQQVAAILASVRCEQPAVHCARSKVSAAALITMIRVLILAGLIAVRRVGG